MDSRVPSIDARKETRREAAARNRLFNAVAAYMEERGGNVVVAGPIRIQRWPGDGEYRYSVEVCCTGTAPALESEA